MLQIIRSILQQFINDIDSGNSDNSEEQLNQILDIIQTINSKDLNKIQSANYIGVCRATFDNYVRKGLLPSGRKQQGSNTLYWNKYDLDKFRKSKKL